MGNKRIKEIIKELLSTINLENAYVGDTMTEKPEHEELSLCEGNPDGLKLLAANLLRASLLQENELLIFKMKEDWYDYMDEFCPIDGAKLTKTLPEIPDNQPEDFFQKKSLEIASSKIGNAYVFPKLYLLRHVYSTLTQILFIPLVLLLLALLSEVL